MIKQIQLGYKQTKVGVIPEEWEVVKLGDVLKIGSGKDYKHLNNGNIPVYGTGGYMLSVDDFLYDGESVCIGRKGTIDKPMFLNGKFWTVDTLFYSHSFKDSLPKYIYLSFLSIDWLKYNEASGVPSLSKATIESILIPLPPTKEQEKIAEILSTWDDAIAKQEQLIQQKKIFKKGIMQQIFSQKIRFKDDNGNDYPAWKKYKLTKVAKTSIGLVTTMTTSYVENNGTPLIRNSDILPNKIKDDLIQLSNLFANQYNSRKLRYLDVVTVHTGDVGISAVINEKLDGCHGFATLNTRVDQEILNPFYLSCYFNSSFYISYAIKMSTGDGRCNFNLKDFDNSIIPTPALNEQARIVDFLSTIDNGITKQTEVLDQLKLQKQSLMQKLLTGQVRMLK